jgi:hypothetical protein
MAAGLVFARGALEIAGVIGALEAVGQRQELSGIDEALAEGDLLDAGDLEALPAFHDMDELCGLEQGIMGARSSQAKPRPSRSTWSWRVSM